MAINTIALKKKIETLKKGLNNKFISASQKEKIKSQVEKLEKEVKASKPAKPASSTLSKLQKLVNKKKYGVYSGKGVDLKKDADIPAKPIGKRKAKSGNTYYEYRANRIDVKQPSKKAPYPKLEQGGMMAKGGQVSGKFLFRPYKKEGNFYVSTQFKDVHPDSVEMKGLEGKLKGDNFQAANYVAEAILDHNDYIDKVDVIKEGSSVLKNKKVFSITRDGDIEGRYDVEYFEQGGYMAKGGMLNHGFHEGDKVLEIYKGHGIVENNESGVIEVIDPSKGTRFIIALDEERPTGKKSMSMTKEQQLKSAKEYIDWVGGNIDEDKMAKGGMFEKPIPATMDKYGNINSEKKLQEDLKYLEEAYENKLVTKAEYDESYNEIKEQIKLLQKKEHGGYMAKGGKLDKKIDVIVYQDKKLEFTNYDIEELLEDRHIYFSSDNLPKWLIAVRNKGNRNFPKNNEQVVSLLHKILDTNENVFIDVDSNKPAYLNKILIGGKQIMAKGGVTEKEVVESNAQMVLSQIRAVKHHAQELSNVVSTKSNIEAWVVGKIERASTDLSDITHYLEGNKDKMSMGGSVRYYSHKMDK